LRAIGPVPGLTFEVDPVALEQFVTLGAVLTPRSIYRRVHKLAPAHLLTIEATGEPRLARYWRLSLEPREGVIDEDWIAECRTRLLASVERHLIADVPVGAFLSGGVDSAAVVAAISRLGAEPLRTFTIGFDQRRFDETAAAAELAAHLGCEHRIERLDAATAIGLLPQVAATYDEPFADDSALPTWLVSRLARQEVTVALSGDGGDELFAGYRRYRSELQLGRLKRLPGAQTVLARLARLPMPSGRRFARLARLAHDSALERPVERSFAKQYASSTAVLASLWGPSLPPSAVAGYRRWADELFDCGTGKAADADAIRLPDDPLRSLLAVDTQVWLPDDILTKVDRASMAHSLEVRVPLLSHRFVDWTATVPNRLKLDCGVGKQLLRRAVADWLPPGFLDRPKQGFSIPLAAWALGEFGDHALAVWNSSGIADSGWFSSAAMSRLLYEHRRGDADHGAVIFTLLMLAYWWPTRLGAAAAAPPNNCS
jgi:asparagine synthase (glutamine-hydrolysing)